MDVGRITQGSGLPKDGPEQAQRPLQVGDTLAAKVLSTEGRTARVSVNGQTVEVQTSVPLAPGDELSLKVARGPGGQVQLQVMALQGKESLLGDAHVSELCEKMGLPTDRATVDAAKLLLKETGSAEPGQVRDLAKLLATLKTPDERAAATFLVARNLPATPAAVLLVAGRPGDPATAGKRVADRLEALKKAAPALLEALAGLDLESSPEAGTEAGPTRGDAQKLAEALARLAKGLNPLEAEILAFLKDRQGNLGDRLSQNLSAILERHAETDSNPQAKELAKEIRFQQLSDSATAQRLNPVEVRLPLVFGNQSGDLTVQKWQGNAKDPAGHARVLLRLDMDQLGPLTVDLMYAKGQVGGRLTVGDAATQEFLGDRLETSLGGVGIGVSHLEVGTARGAAAVEAPQGRFDVRM